MGRKAKERKEWAAKSVHNSVDYSLKLVDYSRNVPTLQAGNYWDNPYPGLTTWAGMLRPYRACYVALCLFLSLNIF